MPDVRSPEPAHDGAQILTPDGRSLPLVSARLRVEAGGGLARVVLEQTSENPDEETLRVTYKMPLPVDGAVSGYAFQIGSRTITGKVDRKESARAHFEEAIVQGRTAALLEQEKADIFTQEIGNVPGAAPSSPRSPSISAWRGSRKGSGSSGSRPSSVRGTSPRTCRRPMRRRRTSRSRTAGYARASRSSCGSATCSAPARA